MTVTQLKQGIQLFPGETGVCADEFCAIASKIDCVVNHPPCAFIKTDAQNNFLGWAVSVFSQQHDEAVYLVSHGRNLQLFPSLDEVLMFLGSNDILTFNVSSAM
ncbi:hypothetical protein A1QO_15565 [Vibrio genomosp. F10 str. ZF-129]|uniref:Uncharacterized protein n=1 Tax=Vibrio genomosp. F10 str. ZF-129 TaxID=1187848 RepID=A0A1E5BA13_9VIBR|nr:hypothetical protein [Vibrio genomosp. F10]OEE30749.1 hypothetical protein A1QO_15565 [Vibrio genomosp. F10 str. ZF-129]